MSEIEFSPSNFIQYPLPFNVDITTNTVYSGIYSQDHNMREVLHFINWEGVRHEYDFPDGISEDYQGFVAIDEPADDTAIAYHLAIHAKENCEFYIMNYEKYNKDIELANEQTIPAGWVIHRRKYRIGMGNKLEFQNVRILSVGIVDIEKNNSEYFGKNAQLDMCISTFGNMAYLDTDGDMYEGIIDPFTVDVIGKTDDNSDDVNGDTAEH